MFISFLNKMCSVRMSSIVRCSRNWQGIYNFPGMQYVAKRMKHDVTQKQTLDDLNNLEVDTLKEFKNIGIERAKRLIAYRQEKGELQSLSELGNIDGFSKVVIESLEKEGLVKRKTRLYTYTLNEATANQINSIAAVGIGRNEVYWCLMSRNCHVTAWESCVLNRDKKYIPESFVSQVKEVVSRIPCSDITVIEAQTYKASSKDPFLFPFILKNRLTEAIIHAVLKGPTLSFNPNIIKSFFKLSKGFNKQYYSVPLVDDLMKELKRKNRVSHDELEENIDSLTSQPEYTDVVQSICNGQQVDLAFELKDLEIQSDLIENFQKQKQKDGLANVFLLAYAFICIEILYRNDVSF